MKLIETALAPLPAGHYSQAVVAGGLIFVAGQLPFTPGPVLQRVMPHGIDAQTRQVLQNLDAVLQAAGAGLAQLVSIQIFIPDIALWGTVDGIYREFLGSHKPARTVIPCGALHHGALIEINAVALATCQT
jgi:2-iminobutanoate/2-iminopropanoate deaminase